MKEITYEDWQKNPTPRMMWVWDLEEKEAAWKLYLACGKRGLVEKFTANEWEDNND